MYVHTSIAIFFTATDKFLWDLPGMSWQHLHQPCTAHMCGWKGMKYSLSLCLSCASIKLS